MSHRSIFGERYFSKRERLARLMRAIHTLASEANVVADECSDDQALQRGLCKPMKFMACGEVNAGKSTLLNALSGSAPCPTGVLPVTGRIICYRFGETPRDIVIDSLMEEKFRPDPSLENVELIDSPGTNMASPQQLDRLVKLAEDVDLLLAIFPVTNPWGASTWDFMNRLDPTVLDRVVLIIHQADLRGERDLEVIRGHVADLSKKRLGRAMPIFAVSGKQGYEALVRYPTDYVCLRASGVSALADFISHAVCDSPERKTMLETWRGHAAKALRTVEDGMDDQKREIHEHERFIDSVEREIEEMRALFIARIPSLLKNVADAFQTEALGISRLLHRRLGAAASMLRLFTGGRIGHQIEAAFMDRLDQTIQAVAEQDCAEVVDACMRHWKELEKRVQSVIGTRLESAEPLHEILASTQKNFVQRIGDAAREGIVDLRMRGKIDNDLRIRNMGLISFVMTTLVMLTAGAISGSLGMWWLPAILCGLAALFFAGGVIRAWVTRKSITQEFQHHLLVRCDAFAGGLKGEYEDALRAVFHDYAVALGKLRGHVLMEKLAIEPRSRRWQELFLTLKAIEQDL